MYVYIYAHVYRAENPLKLAKLRRCCTSIGTKTSVFGVPISSPLPPLLKNNQVVAKIRSVLRVPSDKHGEGLTEANSRARIVPLPFLA